MRALDLKVPPLAVGVIMGALMWLVSWAAPGFRIAIPAGGFIAAGLAMTGAAIAALGIVSIRRAKTTIHPMKPEASSSLVLTGVYRRTRNPMYLGLLFVLAGWASCLSNPLVFLLLPAFLYYMSRFQIEPEERALASIFGQEFTAYKSRVRRWL